MGLDWLIAPITLDSFRDRHWARAPLRIDRRTADYYSVLFTEAALEEALLVASRVGNAVDELTEDENPRRIHGHQSALAALHAGRSLRIVGIQRFSLKLAKLSRDLEQTGSAPVNINLYLSPPSGKKALRRHFDTHDVFALQLFGRKRWRLFGPPAEFPLEFLPLLHGESDRDMRKFRLDQRQDAGEVELTDEFVLTPGDLLYLPRGFWHEAETEPGQVSCHLTVGTQPVTYAELLTLALARAAKSDPRLRKPLPMGFATHGDASHEIDAAVAEIGKNLSLGEYAQAALNDLNSLFYRNRGGALDNRLLNLGSPAIGDRAGADSSVRIRAGLVMGVDESTAPPQLVFGADRFHIDRAHVEACRFICRGEAFTPADLPGELSEAQKLTLVNQLIAENALVLREDMPRTDGATERATEPRWLPARFKQDGARVQWIKADEGALREPFFQQTVRRVCGEDPRNARWTGIEELLRVGEDLPPSGFIFHVSRCGSTLLANMARACPGTIVVSEPEPFSQALSFFANANEPDLDSHRAAVLRALMRAYGQRRASERRLIIKFTSWNLLYLREIRKLWPETPCVLLIRDPLEVAASCMKTPPAWMTSIQSGKLGDLRQELQAGGIVSQESVCAHILGEFYRTAAAESTGQGYSILDYEALDTDVLASALEFLGIAAPEQHSVDFDGILRTYSKDPLGSRLFTADSEAKRASASKLLRQEIAQWVEPFYNQLLCAATPGSAVPV